MNANKRQHNNGIFKENSLVPRRFGVLRRRVRGNTTLADILRAVKLI